MGEILQRLSAETEVPTELLIEFGRWVLEADQQEEDGEGKQQEPHATDPSVPCEAWPFPYRHCAALKGFTSKVCAFQTSLATAWGIPKG